MIIIAGRGRTVNLNKYTSSINNFSNNERYDWILGKSVSSRNLRKLKMKISKCSVRFENYEFCTAGLESSNQSFCIGDSGSSMIKRRNGKFEIVGIASRSYCFGSTNVFVDVSKFLPWIQKNLEKFVDPHHILWKKALLTTKFMKHSTLLELKSISVQTIWTKFKF